MTQETQEYDLAESAGVINDAHERCQKAETQCHDALRNANEAALEAGRRLLALKKQVPFGEFQNWITDNCICSVRHAQRYMALAKHEQQLSKWMPSWTGLLTPTAAMHEATSLARNAKPSKATGTEQSDWEDKAEAHETRVETFNSLVDGDLVEIDGEASLLHEPATKQFIEAAKSALTKLARQYAKRLCKKKKDKDRLLVGMLLVNQLKEQLDPAQLFAPKACVQEESHSTASLPADPIEVGQLLSV